MDESERVKGRAYQAGRDPERFAVEEPAQAPSSPDNPRRDDDSAMCTEQRLRELKAAAHSSEIGSVSDNTPSELSAREVCQVLREVIWGRHVMTRVDQESWDEVYAGHFQVNVDGWQILIYNDCDDLDYCEECVSSDGRRWSFDAGDRYGTDPIALLSTWEHQTLEQLLKTL